MKSLLLILLTIFSFRSYGIVINIDSMSAVEFKEISKELGANYSHTMVTGARSIGKLFGMELGLLGGVTSTEEFESVTKRANPGGDNLELIPHGGLLFGFSLPFGMTFELNYIPEIDFGDVTVQKTSFGLLLSGSDALVWDTPVDIGLRFHMSQAKLGYHQFINNASTGNLPVSAEVEFDVDSFGIQTIFSGDFKIFQPYFVLGWMSVSNKTSIQASSGTLFGFSNAQSAESDGSGGQYGIGMEYRTFPFKVGGEIMKILDSTRLSLKCSIFI